MENLDLIALFNSHVLPHIVNIAIAIAIFVIGRWVVKIIKNVLSKALEKAKTDPILSDFIQSITTTLMMFIVIIAALSQLGIDTSSFICINCCRWFSNELLSNLVYTPKKLSRIL